eukprot:766485-Hanusia_phi.AAC.1
MSAVTRLIHSIITDKLTNFLEKHQILHPTQRGRGLGEEGAADDRHGNGNSYKQSGIPTHADSNWWSLT